MAYVIIVGRKVKHDRARKIYQPPEVPEFMADPPASVTSRLSFSVEPTAAQLHNGEFGDEFGRLPRSSSGHVPNTFPPSLSTMGQYDGQIEVQQHPLTRSTHIPPPMNTEAKARSDEYMQQRSRYQVGRSKHSYI